jgi:hypothetical protein
MVPLGINRIVIEGVGIGGDLYYQQSAQFMFLVLLAFALTPRWGGRRRPSQPAGRIGSVALRSLRWAVPAAAVVTAGYAALYITSVHSMAKSSWQTTNTYDYVRTVISNARRVIARTGRAPNLIDAEVPIPVMSVGTYPNNRYSFFFPVIDADLRYDQPTGPAYVVTASGELEGVHLRALARGRLTAARPIPGPLGAGTTALDSARRACVPGGGEWELQIPLDRSTVVPTTTTQPPFAIRVSYTMPVRREVGVLVANAGGADPADSDPHFWGPGRGTALVVDSWATTVASVDIWLPGGSCVTGLRLGQYVPNAA